MENPQPAASSVKTREVEQGEALGGGREENNFPRFGKSGGGRGKVGGVTPSLPKFPVVKKPGKAAQREGGKGACKEGGKEGGKEVSR